MTTTKSMEITFDDIVYETMFFIFALASIIAICIIHVYDFWEDNKETFHGYLMLAKDYFIFAVKYLRKNIPILTVKISKKTYNKINNMKTFLKYFFIKSFLFRKNIINEMRDSDDLEGGEYYSEYTFGPVSYETLSYYYSN